MKTDCEILRYSVQLTGCNTIYLGAYHRLHEDDEQSFLELERSLTLINRASGRVREKMENSAENFAK